MILHFKALVYKERMMDNSYLFARLESTKHFPYFDYDLRPNLHHSNITMDTYAALFDNTNLIKDLKENHKFIEMTIIIND
jgi:hypothetical protein